ncbi:hypothetical protein HZC53_03065 [Candidatus Uhrbacteria bacterium]|nr:hypothetical protein [Candidatus Uhrbacteria bacterium]
MLKDFKRFLSKLGKIHGLQGWWPRLIRHEVRSTRHAARSSVLHHPGPKSRWLSKVPADQAFEIAIGAILTQNTSWTNVEKALICLAEKGMVTSKSLARAQSSSIESCVRSSGYYRQKAKKLKLFAKFVQDELGGDLWKIINRRPERSAAKSKDLFWSASIQDDGIGQARELLLSLWGIGPETADTILLYGLNRPIFVVDAYTRRLLVHLSGDTAWLKRPYDEVRQFCESALVSQSRKVQKFQESHALIVRWGKDNSRLRIS